MASSYRLRSLFVIFAAAFAAVSSYVAAATDGLVSAFNAAVRYFDFKPTGADALVLDRLGRDVSLVDKRSSPFKAFIERAETHSLFSAGGFHIDPGRAAA